MPHLSVLIRTTMVANRLKHTHNINTSSKPLKPNEKALKQSINIEKDF